MFLYLHSFSEFASHYYSRPSSIDKNLLYSLDYREDSSKPQQDQEQQFVNVEDGDDDDDDDGGGGDVFPRTQNSYIAGDEGSSVRKRTVEFMGMHVSYPQYVRLRAIQREVIKMDQMIRRMVSKFFSIHCRN